MNALTNFTQQALQDSQKAISALNAEQAQIRKVVLQNRLALAILQLCKEERVPLFTPNAISGTYIPDMSTDVTHFTKHMTKMIGAMETPEASIDSLWETVTSSPWRKTILMTIILIVLFFFLFVPCICNYVIGLVSSRMKAFELQMVV